MRNFNIALSAWTDEELLTELQRRGQKLKWTRQGCSPDASNLSQPCTVDCRTKVEQAAESLLTLNYHGDKIEPTYDTEKKVRNSAAATRERERIKKLQ
jgi:hypothetical protein